MSNNRSEFYTDEEYDRATGYVNDKFGEKDMGSDGSANSGCPFSLVILALALWIVFF